ncbi:hypothetical protein [Sinosporangium siamense]|uniref:Uncharacterized protein n=2 Tax=Sinosporangium siamense TaxID=1367973 RepID=A0A919V4P2_9ACTN|nr:hypothetical protein [Sinosporangium siamense]GII89941.1 hypothetical protein Ssi02_01720 [Sinosporangium siamense]
MISTSRDLNRFFHALFSGKLVGVHLLDALSAPSATPAPAPPRKGLIGPIQGGVPGPTTTSYASSEGGRYITISTTTKVAELAPAAKDVPFAQVS